METKDAKRGLTGVIELRTTYELMIGPGDRPTNPSREKVWGDRVACCQGRTNELLSVEKRNALCNGSA